MKPSKIFALGMVAALSSCGSNDTVSSEDVNENKIYQHYRVQYDADANSLSHFAQFTLGGSTGTTIKLASPSTVKVEDTSMELVDGDAQIISFIGTFYTLKQTTTEPNSEFTFQWTMSDGTTKTNKVELATAVAVKNINTNQEIDTTQDLNVEVTTEATTEVRCQISVTEDYDPESNENPSYGTSVEAQSKSCTFSSEDLAKLKKGNATLQVSHSVHQFSVAESTDEGGKRVSVYNSKKVAITLK